MKDKEHEQEYKRNKSDNELKGWVNIILKKKPIIIISPTVSDQKTVVKNEVKPCMTMN